MHKHEERNFLPTKMIRRLDDEDSSSSGTYAQIQDNSSTSAISNTSFEIIDLGDPPAFGNLRPGSDQVFPILRPDLGWIKSIDDYENVRDFPRKESAGKKMMLMVERADKKNKKQKELAMIPRPKWSNRRVTFGKTHSVNFRGCMPNTHPGVWCKKGGSRYP